MDGHARALAVGLKALSRRDLSRTELMARLERAGCDPDDAERACARLAADGYQSDERTARERARVLAARLYGDRAIRADLERRGLGTSEIDAAIAGVPDESERATALARRSSDAARCLRALQRRGYSEATIEHTTASALRTSG